MKITLEIEIMCHEFARDREEDPKLAAHDETSVSFFKLLREFAQRVVEVKVQETVDFSREYPAVRRVALPAHAPGIAAAGE
jgi:glyoxylase-like metal-dependent hydrolase (beta-lactamase superfamily II)